MRAPSTSSEFQDDLASSRSRRGVVATTPRRHRDRPAASSRQPRGDDATIPRRRRGHTAATTRSLRGVDAADAAKGLTISARSPRRPADAAKGLTNQPPRRGVDATPRKVLRNQLPRRGADPTVRSHHGRTLLQLSEQRRLGAERGGPGVAAAAATMVMDAAVAAAAGAVGLRPSLMRFLIALIASAPAGMLAHYVPRGAPRYARRREGGGTRAAADRAC